MGNDLVKTGSTSVEYPAWYEEAAKKSLGYADDFMNQPYEGYGGQRVAPLDSATQAATARMSGMTAPTQITERIVDENGRLGAISDYMNPYLEASLDPAIRKMQEASTREMQAAGNLRHGSGAYGDARHGVREGVIASNTQQNIGDMTSQTMAAGYGSAMGLRANDLARFQQVQDTQFQQEMATIQQQLMAGQVNQQQAQNQLDANYESYLRRKQDEYDRMTTYASVIGGTNAGQTTTTMGQRQYPLLQAAGSILGAIPFAP